MWYVLYNTTGTTFTASTSKASLVLLASPGLLFGGIQTLESTQFKQITKGFQVFFALDGHYFFRTLSFFQESVPIKAGEPIRPVWSAARRWRTGQVPRAKRGYKLQRSGRNVASAVPQVCTKQHSPTIIKYTNIKFCAHKYIIYILV